MTMNKILVIGNLGRDPEMRYTPNGQAVTNFSVATNRRYTASDGEQKEETEWFRISVWGKQAETCNQYLTKGQKVYVEGRLKSRSYETRDGQTRFENEIFATDVRFLSAAGSRADDFPQDSEPAGGSGMDAGRSGMDADDLPF
jgi:single-strand DNA-binding protein